MPCVFSFILGLENDPLKLEHRRHVFGANIIPPKPMKTFFQLMVEASKDATLIMLEIACGFSLVAWLLSKYVFNDDHDEHDDDEHGWIDSVAIFISVCVVILVSAANDYTKERQFRGLQKKIEGDHNFSVIRDGIVIQVRRRAIELFLVFSLLSCPSLNSLCAVFCIDSCSGYCRWRYLSGISSKSYIVNTYPRLQCN